MLADKVLELRHLGNIGVAYTYSEPLIGYEYVRDCAALVHERGMANVLVTNGTITEDLWRALLPFIDTINVAILNSLGQIALDLGHDRSPEKAFTIGTSQQFVLSHTVGSIHKLQQKSAGTRYQDVKLAAGTQFNV